MLDRCFEGCVGLRVGVRSMAAAQVSRSERGLLCVGVRGRQGLPPLIAICDETDTYGGASATNAMACALEFLRREWQGVLPVQKSNIVEFDSDGGWDFVVPQWRAGGTPTVEFLPLRWADSAPRSEAALAGAFASQAEAVLAAIDEMRATGAWELHS